MEIRETTLREANAFVERLHRHHGRAVGHKWSLAAYKDGHLCAVAIVGRPSGRYLDDGNTLEVTRLCSDGTRNACSALYAACARRAKREGYAKIITFTLQSEPGTSLIAAGWELEAAKAGKPRWNRQRYEGRPEQLTLFPKKEPPAEYKKRWAKRLKTKEDTTT
ncbi:XF1762 family protein [Oscillibacter sp.]|uniref:XF1762 family protein n=1 Tax=Oscillibacter sp. TaxID=1945593 RepID=UPI0025879790|nr:XF1762 family protein [Oscillibacter sp.]